MAKNLTKKLMERRQREAADAVLRDLAIEKLGELCDQTDLTILYALHVEFGFGRERLLRFYKAWMEVHMDMIERFRCIEDRDTGRHDGSDYLMIEKRLKEIGVTMEDLREIATEEDRKYLKWREEKMREKIPDYSGKIL